MTKSVGIFFWREKMSVQSALQPVQSAESSAKAEGPIVIIGAGPVGMRLFEQLALQQPNRSIIIMGNENQLPYDRVQLSSMLAGEVALEDISVKLGYQHADEKARFVSAHIERIDRENSVVVDQQGLVYPYGQLVLATGSKPYIPQIKGIDRPGVFTFRNVRDAEQLAARRARSKHTIILGGGLLGIEVACAMKRHHTEVSLIDHNVHLMFNQLDDGAAAMVADQLGLRGIKIVTGSGIASVKGQDAISSVILRDGLEVDCDTLIVATGIRPNIELARASKLAVGRGVRVDSTLRTSDPNIFAVGECSEFDGRVYGLVAPGFEQAEIALNQLGESGDIHYSGSATSVSLKVAGLAVFSFGQTDSTDIGVRRYVFQTVSVYRRLFVLHGRLIGVIAIGEWSALSSLREHIRTGRTLPPWKIWRFRNSGELETIDAAGQFARLPDSAIICNCNAVSKSTILAASKGGACSVERLGELSKAGTGCGSCRPLLAAATNSADKAAPVQGYKALFIVAITSVILASLALLYPGAPYAETVQLEWHWDILWTSELNKQITGYTLLGVSIAGLLMSLRKRLNWFADSNFSLWRFSHVLLGAIALMVLAAHTGFRYGDNLNMILTSIFVALALVGGLMSIVISLEHRLLPSRVRLVRAGSLWVHIILCWPIPALLSMHVLKTYYF